MHIHKSRIRAEIAFRCVRYWLQGYVQISNRLPTRIFYIAYVHKIYTNHAVSNHSLEVVDPKPIAAIGIIYRGGRQRWKFNYHYLTKQEAEVAVKILNNYAEEKIEA
jgi:hypothetical protein